MGSDGTDIRTPAGVSRSSRKLPWLLLATGALLIAFAVSGIWLISPLFPAFAALNAAVLLLFSVLLARFYLRVICPISEFSESLSKLDAMKSDFISTASHEMRTPLTSIGGYVKLLAAGDAGPLTEVQKDFLQVIDTNVVRLNHLISDILEVERMDSRQFALKKEPQDLREILMECRNTMSVVAAGKRLEFRCQVREGVIPVLGDRVRLVQLFTNLISNAIKYTQQGFVEIEVEQRAASVGIHVRDTGIGMTPEEQEGLFQRFFRAQSAVATGEGGTGLGLVIARQIVEAHGGTIVVDSGREKGSQFTVTLPLHETYQALDSRSSSLLEGLVGAQNRRALLAESNSDLKALIQHDLDNESSDQLDGREREWRKE